MHARQLARHSFGDRELPSGLKHVAERSTGMVFNDNKQDLKYSLVSLRCVVCENAHINLVLPNGIANHPLRVTIPNDGGDVEL